MCDFSVNIQVCFLSTGYLCNLLLMHLPVGKGKSLYMYKYIEDRATNIASLNKREICGQC